MPIDFRLFDWAIKSVDDNEGFMIVEQVSTGHKWLMEYSNTGKPGLRQISNHIAVSKDTRDTLAQKISFVIQYNKGYYETSNVCA